MSNSDVNKKLLALLSVAENDDDKIFRKLQTYLKDKAEGDFDYDGKKKLKPLKDLFDGFVSKNEYRAGEIVKWKNNLKNRRKPKYLEPAIVIEHIKDNPSLNSAAEGSSLYREPLDLVLGLVDEEGDFDIYYFDSRRFESY